MIVLHESCIVAEVSLYFLQTYEFSCSSVRKLAVNGLSLAVEQDRLLALLGIG